jgi:hypothetical protein
MIRKRKQLILAAAMLLLIPAGVWLLLLQLGHVAAPGMQVVPPFNFSDRIVSI